jgi:arylsulfatase A-like enzyme
MLHTRRGFFLVLSLLSALNTLAQPLISAPPNILVIMADDLGYGDLASYGANDLQSPHIDQLVKRGLKFTEFYANCPVCSPTRASFISGRYPELVGVPGVIRTQAENNWGELSRGIPTVASQLRNAGYQTALIGKWHLGLTEPHWPNNRGFDFFQGWLGDMMDDYYTHRRHGINYMRHNTATIDPKGHATDLFTQWSCDYLRKHAQDEAPFFLYLCFNAPHTPIQPPQSWLTKVQQREADTPVPRAKLIALIEHMDNGIGKILHTLNETGLADNTVIVFTSDNGGQLNVGANNGPLRDGKQSMYEGGLKVPTCVVWPNVIAANTITNRRALTMDLFPTLCEIAQTDIPNTVDGISLLPTLLGNHQITDDRDFFFHRREGGTRYEGLTTNAIRRDEWKLLRNSPFAPLELYNLESDPLEQTDLAKTNLRQFRELSAALRVQIQRGGAVPWQPTLGKPK